MLPMQPIGSAKYGLNVLKQAERTDCNPLAVRRMIHHVQNLLDHS